jgi:hypothetical protein
MRRASTGNKEPRHTPGEMKKNVLDVGTVVADLNLRHLEIIQQTDQCQGKDLFLMNEAG